MSDMIQLTFPDGAVKEFAKGTSTEEIAQSISRGLRKKAVAGKLAGNLVDLKAPLEADGEIAIITPYQAQVAHISSMLREEFPDLVCGSVDGMQGQEREVRPVLKLKGTSL